jgi:SAM-dependent methyltransferase
MTPFDEELYLASNPDVARAVKAGQFRSGREHFELHGRAEGRSPTGERPGSPESSVPPPIDGLLRFEQRPPSAQTAVDVFAGRWASDLRPLIGVEHTGPAPLFTDDERPRQAANTLGEHGRFDRMTVLELGPLEAAHSFLLEQLGAAEVTAVEASSEAFLKCLIVKEILQLTKCRFLYGDIIGYLESCRRRFDLVFCSGVLYHMDDPVRLIRLVADVTDRCFVWSHYYDPNRHPVPFEPIAYSSGGFTTTYWSHTYGDRSSEFWGGNRPTAVWLERDGLLDAFRSCGLTEITIIQDNNAHPNGPSITFAARRPTV